MFAATIHIINFQYYFGLFQLKYNQPKNPDMKLSILAPSECVNFVVDNNLSKYFRKLKDIPIYLKRLCKIVRTDWL